MRRTWLVVGWLALGCGKRGDDGASPSPTAVEAPGAPAPAAAAHDASPAAVTAPDAAAIADAADAPPDAAASAPHALDGKGPPARVVAFYHDGIDDELDHPFEDGVAFVAVLEPPPGWARAPALDVTLRAGGKPVAAKVAMTRGEPLPASMVRLVFATRPARRFEATLTVDGATYGTLTIDPDDSDEGFRAHLTRPLRRSKAARCDGLECPDFPALSKDGRSLVVRDDDHLIPPGTVCKPPVAPLTSYYDLHGDELWSTGSRDLAGYEVLRCAPTATLPDGLRIEVEDGDDGRVVAIRDAGGAVVARAEVSDVPDLCPSKRHRVVVVRAHDGMGGDCQEVGSYAYELLRY